MATTNQGKDDALRIRISKAYNLFDYCLQQYREPSCPRMKWLTGAGS